MAEAAIPATLAPMNNSGKCRWYIADAYLPSTGIGERWESHESLCVLNVTRRDAHLQVTLYFEDRPPVDTIRITVAAERNLHLGTNRPERWGGFAIPRDVPYAIVVVSDVPVICQYSRMDVTQPNMTLMSTTPYCED